MDNHPIPQDITGFQFKLIGNLTVRQFVYFAIGGVLAWLFFFILGLPTIIKWPLAILSFGIGAMFAFIPIDGRPMDTMVSNFIKAIISPTQFVYQKEGGKLENQNLPHSQPLKLQSEVTQAPNPVAQNIPQPIIQQMPASPPTPAPQPIQFSVPPPIQVPISSPTPAFVIQEVEEPDELKRKNRELEEAQVEQEKLKRELESLKKQLEDANKAKAEAAAVIPQPAAQPAPAQIPNPFVPPTPNQIELEKQLIESNRQREALEKQILTERAQNADAAQQKVNPTIAAPVQSQRVRSVPPGMEKSIGIPSVPENPNLITGIVKDPRGNPLQNILVEVKDQDSNPVRAFKTNGLGKFASATSLSNGKYLISFEDTKEQHKFDAVEVELIGLPVMPLEIISVDPREELRRELFK